MAQPARAVATVHDGVFSASALATLAMAPDAAGVYRRSNNGASTAHECAIESLLAALDDDTSREVEYWGRDEWLSMEAHRDVDEEIATVDGELRMPDRVVIAYGECEAGMAAPTVLWCNATDAAFGGETGHEIGGRLLVIPALSGRLLDFDGRLLHSVPKPTSAWCRETGGSVDDMTVEGPPRQRSVLVLNCWSDHAPSSNDAEEDMTKEAMADARELDSAEETMMMEAMAGGLELEDPEMKRLLADATGSQRVDDGGTTTVATYAAVRACCEPRWRWKAVEILPSETEETTRGSAAAYRFAVPTFGTDEPLVTEVAATADVFAAALHEATQPRYIRTLTAAPAMGVGVPSMDGARDERRE